MNTTDLLALIRAPLGTFADIVFMCNRFCVRTFTDYQRESKARFHKHDLINATPALEFLGADLGSINFKMIFSVSLGVNPSWEVERLRYLCEHGRADWLIFGNSVVGDHMWTIESLSEDAKHFDPSGHVIVSTANVVMKEYRRFL